MMTGDFLQSISRKHSGSFRCIFNVNKGKVLWPNLNVSKHMLAKISIASSYQKHQH